MDDKRLERIELKIDDSNEHLAKIDVTLAAQHVSLKEHMRRTALIEKELQPIKKHVNMVQGALRLIGVTAAVCAILEFIRLIK